MQQLIKKYIGKIPFLRNILKRVEFYAYVFKNYIKHLRFINQKIKQPSFDIYFFGWFGTETAGDKLILLGLLYELFTNSKSERRIAICSTNPKFTTNTLVELCALCDELRHAEFANWIQKNCTSCEQNVVYGATESSLTIIGGGPIMEDPEIFKWALIAKHITSKNKARLIIAGCGVGPLWSNFTKHTTKVLLSCAEKIICRNHHQILDGFHHTTAVDPAFILYKILRNTPETPHEDSTLAYNARAIQFQYAPELPNATQSYIHNEQIKIVDFVKKNQIKKIFAFSTHESDTLTDTKIMKTILGSVSDQSVEVVYVKDDLVEIVRAIKKSGYLVSTRYHGFILGIALAKHAFGNDYSSQKGKIWQLYSSLHLTPPKANAFNCEKIDRRDFVEGDDYAINARIHSLIRPYETALSLK